LALKKLVGRLTKPVEELDREQLESFCDRLGTTPIEQAQPRLPVRVAGEVRSVRIVPRAGADALEVTVNDGRASVVGVFLGRRRVGGISPGRKLVLEGVVVARGREKQIYNPIYTLL
jgi:RecG-like helicase